MSKTYSAGIVTAYGAAKRAGYQGTYEDFCRQQAGYAGNAAAVEAAKTATQNAANTATTKATEATTAATAAQTAKTQTEQASSQALTDIATARSGAISAVQTEGQTQTANASAAAQAAATSATTASTKASEASASATTATTKATEAAASATSAANAASAAQGVLESIPEGYSDLSEDVDQLKADLGTIFNTELVENAIPISSIDGIYTRTGWNAAGDHVGIPMSTNASYDSYWFVTREDVDIWFNDKVNASYLALIVGGTYQYSQEQSESAFTVFCENGATRYRKSDGNLPTENNKIHIPSGCAVAFTITARAIESVYGLIAPMTIKTVKESFKEKIVKRNLLKYVSGDGVDESTERVEIYLPSKSGYIRYDFLHTESSAKNSDVWRIGYAYYVDEHFVIDFAITTTGEWECAIKLDGRDDFSGGYAHGDEVMNNVLFIVDGVPVDITTLTTMTAFDDLCIVEDSDLYDPSDHTTVYAKHGTEHHFTKSGLSIRQSVKFIIAETVTTAYLAMLPIAKSLSNRIVPNNTFVPLATDSAIRLYNTEKTIIYKTDGNVKAEFSIPIWENLNPSDYTFMCVDNGTTAYNKCYFVNTLSRVSVPQNKLLKTETKYNFVVSN